MLRADAPMPDASIPDVPSASVRRPPRRYVLRRSTRRRAPKRPSPPTPPPAKRRRVAAAAAHGTAAAAVKRRGGETPAEAAAHKRRRVEKPVMPAAGAGGRRRRCGLHAEWSDSETCGEDQDEVPVVVDAAAEVDGAGGESRGDCGESGAAGAGNSRTSDGSGLCAPTVQAAVLESGQVLVQVVHADGTAQRIVVDKPEVW